MLECYKLSFYKSEVFAVVEVTATNLLPTLPFKVPKKGFTYLKVADTGKCNKRLKSL